MAERPKLVFCQNPSIVLAGLLAVFKRLFGYQLIVDRHSSFKFESRQSRALKWRLFHSLSDYTLRRADWTIVTNEYLKSFVEERGGRGLVLQDKLPSLPLARHQGLGDGFHVAFVCTFSPDEPISEIVAAAAHLTPDVTIHVTGRPKGRWLNGPGHDEKGARVRFTGFLSESDYQSLLMSCDCVMVLTTAEHTLTCGAYEAVALQKPMILSDTKTLKAYFSGGAAYTAPLADDIARAIHDCRQRHGVLSTQVGELRQALEKDWRSRAQAISAHLAN